MGRECEKCIKMVRDVFLRFDHIWRESSIHPWYMTYGVERFVEEDLRKLVEEGCIKESTYKKLRNEIEQLLLKISPLHVSEKVSEVLPKIYRMMDDVIRDTAEYCQTV